MNEKEFEDVMERLRQYLETEKAFVPNPNKVSEFLRANEIIMELMPDATRETKNDPIQMGALILRVEGDDIVIRGEREINLFCELLGYVDNFEIYSIDHGKLRFAMVFAHVFKRVKG